jgi:hypothetical protein
MLPGGLSGLSRAWLHSSGPLSTGHGPASLLAQASSQAAEMRQPSSPGSCTGSSWLMPATSCKDRVEAGWIEEC